MRFSQFLIPFALVVFAPAAQASADRVPDVNVEKSCRDAQNFGTTDPQQTYKSCMLDENEAKSQLSKKWSEFKEANRRSCVPVAPSPSYVEMLTCLEMNQESLLPYTEGGGAASPTIPHDSPLPRPAPSPGPRGMR